MRNEFYLPSKPCEDCGKMMKYSTKNKHYCNECAMTLKEKFGEKYFTATDIAIALHYQGGNYGTSGQGMGKAIHAMLRRGLLYRYSKRYYKIVGEQPR